MGRVLSGVQPTGNLHLGNYLGAIRNWVRMQDEHDCFFCIVDLHALTTEQEPSSLRASTRAIAAAYIAAGIDPARSVIFNQSQIAGHCELAWLLGCLTPLGWLNRMTQFKEKAGKHRENAVLGLYGYPVLMAADILLYKATHVPVGEDQKQHLELVRDIANGFNHRYACDALPPPEPIILGPGTRVMSLRDGTSKMSKTDSSEYSRINLTDDADTIGRKIRKAKSDAEMGMRYDEEARPEASNLLSIYAALADEPIEAVCARYADASFSDFKAALTEVAVETLAPIGAEMTRLSADSAYLDGILRDGVERAGALAETTLREIQDIMGLLRP